MSFIIFTYLNVLPAVYHLLYDCRVDWAKNNSFRLLFYDLCISVKISSINIKKQYKKKIKNKNAHNEFEDEYKSRIKFYKIFVIRPAAMVTPPTRNMMRPNSL